MATLLRPPLVSDRFPKRPIGTPESYPNLIASTLRNDVLTLIAPLAFEQLDDSASPRKKQVWVDLTPNLLTSTLFATTEKIRLGNEQWDDSAPFGKLQIRHDVPPNLLGTTLANVAVSLDLPLRVEMWDDGGQPRKRQTLAEQFMGRQVWRDDVPAVMQLDSSAFSAKFQVFREPAPNLTATTLNLVLVPNVVTETQAQAETDLTAAGFTASETFAYSDTIAAGLVISQVPVGGSLAPPASAVSIVISLGVQPSSGVVPAGRPAKHRRYYVEIDDQSFPVASEAQAVELLQRARAIAERTAEASVERATKALRKKVAIPAVVIPSPVISVSPDLEAATAPLIADIEWLYAKAEQLAELRLLLARQLADEDDDDDVLLLI